MGGYIGVTVGRIIRIPSGSEMLAHQKEAHKKVDSRSVCNRRSIAYLPSVQVKT